MKSASSDEGGVIRFTPGEVYLDTSDGTFHRRDGTCCDSHTMVARTPGGHVITDVLVYSNGSACVQAVTSTGVVIFWVPMQNVTVTSS